ncbi:hypothetical protein LJC42_05370 [Eubacteriales bacterium OttesenSCG-928-K08]|nr:hypothetical protein [Eubacteriales bacterium OttesenSCG-928-K08]
MEETTYAEHLYAPQNYKIYSVAITMRIAGCFCYTSERSSERETGLGAYKISRGRLERKKFLHHADGISGVQNWNGQHICGIDQQCEA